MQFRYKALDKDGHSVVGLVKAESEVEAGEKIKSSNLELVDINRADNIFSNLNQNLGIGGLNAWTKSSVYRELATMIKAGVPLMRGLQLISKGANPQIQKIFKSIIDDVQKGRPFSTASMKHPKFFSEIDSSIIRSGETTGSFDKILYKLADSKEKEYILKEKIRSAMTYPIIVFFVVIAIILIMMIKIVPVFEETFAGASQQLPTATLILISMSRFTIDFWWIIFLGLAALIFCLIIAVRRTTVGKYLWSYLKIKVPIFGKIHQAVVLAEISNTLSILLTSGVEIISAMQLAGSVANNEIFRRSFTNISANLEKGIPMSLSMEAYDRIFPPIVIDMVAVGEESGTTDQMLLTLSHYYEEEADNKVKSLTSSLEPLLIVILGLGVAFVVFAIMAPIISLADIIE